MGVALLSLLRAEFAKAVFPVWQFPPERWVSCGHPPGNRQKCAQAAQMFSGVMPQHLFPSGGCDIGCNNPLRSFER
jgi:hypothetical protein